jgi:hypothetical protein
MLSMALWFIAPPACAARKGYFFAPWVCALGAVGVLVLAFFPHAQRVQPPERRARVERLADRIGWTLSAIGVVGWAGFCCLLPLK